MSLPATGSALMWMSEMWTIFMEGVLGKKTGADNVGTVGRPQSGSDAL